MTKKTSKKRVLLSSIISLVLCISMLLGTTMAWFTDTVTNTGNRIEAGGLGVQLLKYNGAEYKDISDGTGDIFITAADDDAYDESAELTNYGRANFNGVHWEPGKTEVVHLQVKNTESLALNYNIILDVTIESADVAIEDAFSYAILPGDYSEYCALNITSWEDILNLVQSGVGETNAVPSGKTTAALKGALERGESDSFALAVHMSEDAGNGYQHKKIKIDTKVVARQMPSESDSFGKDYDKDAKDDTYIPVFDSGKFTDGSFEKAGTWKLMAGSALDTNKSIHGLQSAKLTSASGSTPYVSQKMEVKPGAKYEISGWYLVEGGETGTPDALIGIEQYTSKGASGKTGQTYYLRGKNVANNPSPVEYPEGEEKIGEWVKFKFTYTVPDDRTYVEIKVRSGSKKTTEALWYDGLKMIELE